MRGDGYDEERGSNIRMNKATMETQSWYPRYKGSSTEGYYNGGASVEGRNRGRLDSSSSDNSSSVGKNQSTGRPKKRSHRPRGCRGGGSRRNRREQRAVAAADSEEVQQENRKPSTYSGKQRKAEKVTGANPSQVFGETSTKTESTDEMSHLNSSMQNMLLVSLDTNDNRVFQKKGNVKGNALPGLQLASSSGSSSSSNSSDIGQQQNSERASNYGNSNTLLLNDNMSLSTLLHEIRSSTFDILPSMPQSQRERQNFGSSSGISGRTSMSALPPLPTNSGKELKFLSASDSTSNPYSLQQYQQYHHSQTNSFGRLNSQAAPYFGGTYLSTHQETTVTLQEFGKATQLQQPNHQASLKESTVSGFDHGDSQQLLKQQQQQQQQHYRAERIQKQQQMLAGGGSLFATSPRSFLMGGGRKTTPFM